MYRRFMKITSICLILTMLTMAFPAAFAVNEIAVYVSANTVKVDISPNPSSTVLGIMSYGENMLCTAVKSDWAQVKNDAGAIGYCKKSSLTTKDPNVYNKTIYVQRSGIPVYNKPVTSSKQLGRLKLNAKLNGIAITKDHAWIRVQSGNHFGYVPTAYMDSSPVMNGMTVWCAKTSATVSTTSDLSNGIGKMYFAQQVTLLDAHDGVAKIRHASGAIGYCRLNDLTNKNPNKYSKTAYVQASGDILFEKTHIDSDAKRISRNTKITLVAQTANGWSRVKYQTDYYYIPTLYLGAKKVSGAGRRLAAGKTIVPVYADQSTRSTVLRNLFQGEEVLMIGASGGYAIVRTADNVVGYVPCTFLVPD
ncbi:MAG: hypothetical protein ACLRQ4_24035 [Neglectibacter timonensis]